ncbi:MAG: beta-1,6-N-acetylglucosaminyltransferase [Candidatus Bathyarchaeia archaeon]|jgi:hypothetical protein
MVKLAYCILTYKEPERVVRLINRLQTEEDLFYVHFDKKVGKQKFAEWKQIIEANCQSANLTVVSHRLCKWGSFGNVEALLDAARYFKKFDYNYYINLSGDCYPIKPIREIKKTFEGSSLGYLEFFKLPCTHWSGNGGLDRLYQRFYFFSFGRKPYPKIVSIPRLIRKVPGNLSPYGGSVWFCLPKEQIEYAADFADSNPRLKSFYKRSGGSDEMFFQTVLANSPYKSKLINNNMRYINWKEGDQGHPKILTQADLEVAFNSGKFFARKFSLSADANILQRIDEAVHTNLQKEKIN